MCLNCLSIIKYSPITSCKEEIKKIFTSNDEIAKELNTDVETLKSLSPYNRVILHNLNNTKEYLNQEQINEIINNALCILVTGVDTQIDIWAIQWKNDYKCKTL